MNPVVSTSCMNARACTTASWPVIASHAIRTWWGFVASRIRRACFIMSASTCRRPAVSMMTTSACWRSASFTPAFATFTGSRPSEKTGTPISRPRVRSCSTAAGPLEVGGDQQRPRALALQQERELRAGGGLPGALDAGHHHDGRTRLGQLERPMLAAQRDGELLVHDLHDLLAGREALHDLLGERAAPNPREEVVGDLDGDVGLEQGRAHLTQRVVHLLRVELAPRAELLEDAVQAVG